MSHQSEEMDALFRLHKHIACNTAMSIDARAGYLMAVVRVDPRISYVLDLETDSALLALMQERLAAEDSQRVTVHPVAAQSFEVSAKEMSRADLNSTSNE
ncbi:hypothetical protein [Myxococcus virescens]|uniref:Uncharacterized protein n=1 Tax=Myxococcus virescens TaxID=83456 RepID=A0A511HPW2_9BACT|nr:hypothetical protein [Myxococcus virescens]GEL75642.1 hypothetical protein MVI01_74260 [Myxococcus virescens]SDF27588.1 hypothetical protein SAMN04488504_12751 [Myxococcus virescens]